MDVFLTGATGALGRETVPLLVGAGHRVRALSRSEENDPRARRLGAEPVRGNLFDPASLRAAVEGCDAVAHLATRIPPTTRAARARAWTENDRIRIEGTRHLVDAALAAGIGTFVYPSVVFVYPDGGDRWIDAATTEPAVPPVGILRSTQAAEAEVGRVTAADGRGVVLRMGWFYGPGSAQTDETLRWARRWIVIRVGPAAGYQSFVWIADAATAVVAALERVPAGIYDVVDDEPLRRTEWSAALATAVGRRRLVAPPDVLIRWLAGAAAGALSRSHRVSNRRFREATGWAPAMPNARAGLARLGASDGDDRYGIRV